MKAILCHRFGTPDDLVLADIPDPVAGPGEIVAKVEAVAALKHALPSFTFHP